ncbi:MAG: A24 family peptidase [Gammaproteobacteria bacterium]
MLEHINHIVLLSLLAMTVWTDHRAHRIPNALVMAMMVSGLMLQTIDSGTAGLTYAILGLVVGLVVFLYPYMKGGMAAGDVKLLAATGTFLGPASTLLVGGLALISGALIAGGIIAYQRLRGSGPTTEHILTSQFPFAGAIAIGVSTVLLLRVSL